MKRSCPESVAKLRELTQAELDDLLVIVAGDAATHIEASDTKFAGRLSEREIAVLSPQAICASSSARKYADRHGAFAVTECRGTRAWNAHRACRWFNRVPSAVVTDFPMYEWNEETKTWDAAHHPFTSPHEDDIMAAA